MYLKDSTLTYCSPSFIIYLKEFCTAVSEHDSIFMSNTCGTPIYKETAQNDIISWKKFNFILGKFYSRKNTA